MRTPVTSIPTRAAWRVVWGLIPALLVGCGDADAGSGRPPYWGDDPALGDGGLYARKPPPTGDPPFTIAVLPDTQNYDGPRDFLFQAQASWLAEKADGLNLKLVAHVGDVVHEAWNDEAWDEARRAMMPLEGRVPYLIAPGNHEYGTVEAHMPALDRSTYLQDHFPRSLFEDMQTFGGMFDEGERVDNAYHLFTAGGEDWLVMALEFGPRDAVVRWANALLDSYPERRVIVVTHAYLYTDGQRYDWALRGEQQKYNPHRYGIAKLPGGVHDGEELWRDLLSGRPNLVAVLCGHAHGDGSTDPAFNGVARNIDADTGVAQLLANYQDQPEGGEGYLRLMRFDPWAREVHVTTYSPAQDQYLDDDENDFSFAY